MLKCLKQIRTTFLNWVIVPALYFREIFLNNRLKQKSIESKKEVFSSHCS